MSYRPRRQHRHLHLAVRELVEQQQQQLLLQEELLAARQKGEISLEDCPRRWLSVCGLFAAHRHSTNQPNALFGPVL